MKVGIEIKLDVKKILKERLYQGAKGTYLTMTSFIDSNSPDQYANHGFVAQSVTKEEREQGVKTPILGNIKIFWGPQENQGGGGYQPQNQQQNQRPSQTTGYQGSQGAPPERPSQGGGYNPGQTENGDDIPF